MKTHCVAAVQHICSAWQCWDFVTTVRNGACINSRVGFNPRRIALRFDSHTINTAMRQPFPRNGEKRPICGIATRCFSVAANVEFSSS
jgi:hypothetical protein